MVFLLPMVLIMVMAAGWPLLRTIWLSFTDANIDHMDSAKWVGLANYFGDYGLFDNPNNLHGFWASDWGMAIRNTLIFSVVSVTLETVLGMVVALVLNANFRGRDLVRVAVLVPWAIPTIVSAKMWGWMLHDQYGVVNYMLKGLGLIHANVAWTADPHYAFWTVVGVDEVPFAACRRARAFW